MNCEHALRVLDASLDGELDDATQAQVRGHLAGCAVCRALRDERVGLGDALRRTGSFALPVGLHDAVQRALDEADEAGAMQRPASSATSGRSGAWAGWPGRGPLALRPAWVLAFTGGVAALAFALGLWVGTPSGAPDMSEEVIARHVASFNGGAPRMEVASDDRHEVKPWFAGRLDLVPPVRDLRGEGFALVGGRMDELDGRPAAVLLYAIRRHQISLFAARAPASGVGPLAVTTRRGFSIATWMHDGVVLAAVSDVDPRDLRRFAEALQAPPR